MHMIGHIPPLLGYIKDKSPLSIVPLFSLCLCLSVSLLCLSRSLCICLLMHQSVYSIDIVYTSISIAPLQVLYYSEALPTTARILYRIFHAEAPQETASEGLAQGPYAATRAGLEHTTLQSSSQPRRHHVPPTSHV